MTSVAMISGEVGFRSLLDFCLRARRCLGLLVSLSRGTTMAAFPLIYEGFAVLEEVELFVYIT